MNKSEKLICVVLGLVLAFYIFNSMRDAKKARETAAPVAVAQAPVATPEAKPSAAPAPQTAAAESNNKPVAKPSVPEKVVTLENDELKLSFSSWGAVAKQATLKGYARNKGAVTEENPALEYDFSSAPLGAIEGVANLAANAAYEVRNVTSNEVVFVNAAVTRKYTLLPDYKVQLEEHFATIPQGRNYLSLGSMAMGASKNDLLSVDSWDMDAKGGKVIHHGDDGDSPLKSYLVSSSMGCGGSSSAAGLPLSAQISFPGFQKWIALKDRFFVTALVESTLTNVGFESQVTRDAHVATYRPERISARAIYDTGAAVRTSTFYVGPKKQSLLWQMGMKDVMEFGMWRWVCYPLVWVLNVFHNVIPSYGVAIILLTILVRLIFWPLTHKSTVSMKKMQEIQPLMKELQAKFKDNPQRLQQETWQLYKERKVNPMSSCLPMLVQIPVFIALFNVLRSAVELRYAGFLWIPDLSEPEGLFASWFPFGGLNILPILMAATMALQSALTPSTGDKSQQRMMMVIMPVMMLVMFYSFPSALSLYWTVSQVLSIVQMWMIRRASAKNAAPAVEVIDPPQTRQMRRHSAAE